MDGRTDRLAPTLPTWAVRSTVTLRRFGRAFALGLPLVLGAVLTTACQSPRSEPAETGSTAGAHRDPRSPAISPWILDTHHSGSAANLEVAPDRPGDLRVAILRAEDPTVYNIQLRKPGFGVKGGESYQLTFRARSDKPRQITAGVSMAHEPWAGLGFYHTVSLSPDWNSFSSTFTLTTSDENAQVYFNLGESAVSVELDSVVLRRMPSGDVLEAAVRTPR